MICSTSPFSPVVIGVVVEERDEMEELAAPICLDGERLSGPIFVVSLLVLARFDCCDPKSASEQL